MFSPPSAVKRVAKPRWASGQRPLASRRPWVCFIQASLAPTQASSSSSAEHSQALGGRGLWGLRAARSTVSVACSAETATGARRGWVIKGTEWPLHKSALASGKDEGIEWNQTTLSKCRLSTPKARRRSATHSGTLVSGPKLKCSTNQGAGTSTRASSPSKSGPSRTRSHSAATASCCGGVRRTLRGASRRATHRRTHRGRRRSSSTARARMYSMPL
jgi:hypothetical protein